MTTTSKALLADLAELERIAQVRRIADEETRAFLDELAAIEEALEDLRRQDGEARWEPPAFRDSDDEPDSGRDEDIRF